MRTLLLASPGRDQSLDLSLHSQIALIWIELSHLEFRIHVQRQRDFRDHAGRISIVPQRNQESGAEQVNESSYADDIIIAVVPQSQFMMPLRRRGDSGCLARFLMYSLVQGRESEL